MNFLKFISISALSLNVLVNAQPQDEGYVGPTYDPAKHVQNINDMGGPICKRNIERLQSAIHYSEGMDNNLPAALILRFPNPTYGESVKAFRYFKSRYPDVPIRLHNKYIRRDVLNHEKFIKQMVFEVEKDHWDCLKERLKKTIGPFNAAKAAAKVGRETYMESLFSGFSEDTTNLTPAVKEYIDNF